MLQREHLFFSSRNRDVNCSYRLGKWSQKPAEEWSEVHLWFHSNRLHCVFFPNTPSPLSDRECRVIKMARSVTRLAWSEGEWGKRERGRDGDILCPYQGIKHTFPPLVRQAHTSLLPQLLSQSCQSLPCFLISSLATWYPSPSLKALASSFSSLSMRTKASDPQSLVFKTSSLGCQGTFSDPALMCSLPGSQIHKPPSSILQCHPLGN